MLNKISKLPTFLKLQFASIFINQAFKLRVIVTGIPKCGTTWVARIVSTIPGMYVEVEGGPTSKEAHLREVFLSQRNNTIHDSEIEKAVREFKQHVLRKAYLNEKRLLGYKSPSLDPYALKAFAPNVPVVYLYRDGRDFIVSDAFHNLRLGRIQGDPATEEFWNSAIQRRAHFWKNMVMDNLMSYRKLYDSNLIELRYEDLLEDEVGFIKVKKFFDYLGFSPEVAKKAWWQNSFTQLAGGRQRGDEDRNSFFRKGISGDWKNFFTPQNLHLFNGIAGHAMEVLGYEIFWE